MRIRRRKQAAVQSSLFDHLILWGGLAVLLAAVALVVGHENSCVAMDVKAHSFYTLAPGLEFGDMPPADQEQLLVQLNRRFCTCGCLMTLASCRNNHVSCRTSKVAGNALIHRSAHSQIQAAGSHQ
jgi:hypothetical protein